MRPAPFEYRAPETAGEVLAELEQHGSEAHIIAGGQSLVPLMNLRLARPGVLVDLRRVSELRGIAHRDGRVIIGAATTHAAVAASPVPAILRAAAAHIGHPAIRNRGTFGGSLCHADPAAEWPTVALALGGRIRLAGPSGEREVDVRDFFDGPFMTARHENELLLDVALDEPPPGTTWSFHEFARQSGSFALVLVAALIARDDSGAIERLSIAVGGCGPTPIALDTQPVLGERLAAGELAEALARDLDPPDDAHAGADDRRAIARALLTKALAR